MWRVLLCVVAGVCCAGRSTPPAGDRLARDLDLLYEAASSACEAVWDALPQHETGTVEVDRRGQEKGAWLVEEALCHGLLDRGWDVRDPHGAGSRPDTVAEDLVIGLEYRISKLDMRYRPLRRGLWKGGLVERRAEVELAFKLTDGDRGMLMWVGRGTGEALDVIRGSTLPVVAHPELSPAVEDWPRSRSWAWEVAFTAGLVGLLLGVFYAGTV